MDGVYKIFQIFRLFISVIRNFQFKDLADRTGGKGIDKETFLQYFPLNGLLGGKRNLVYLCLLIIYCISRSLICAI